MGVYRIEMGAPGVRLGEGCDTSLLQTFTNFEHRLEALDPQPPKPGSIEPRSPGKARLEKMVQEGKVTKTDQDVPCRPLGMNVWSILESLKLEL